MKTSLSILVAMVLVASSALAQKEKTADAPAPAVATAAVAAPNAPPNEADMMKQMMELSRLNDNHKLLAGLSGTWNFVVKMWMDGDSSKKPQESKGVAVRKTIMDGRYSEMDVTGKMKMPGADGKMKDVTFKGHGMDAFDNVKKKFVGTWMDNMGTGIMMSEGDYDAATNSLTYTGEIEALPGMKQKVREVMKLTDKDHMIFEWYETRGPQEVKTMEIDYTRAGGKK